MLLHVPALLLLNIDSSNSSPPEPQHCVDYVFLALNEAAQYVQTFNKHWDFEMLCKKFINLDKQNNNEAQIFKWIATET